ncbi:MAG: hypothetical protein D8M57_01345 [Candidatus Scalindua sp. AMX11]|nr:MAG: hypothetical protein DWQ00_15325 [Candidatus Scalindua sp.]NOG85034.1 hypothetical protein [Planctomycetota bacterium]RZV93085.1 MAG: hypothetical protein EX341_04260 [Candidatus Scalindua sp. SCAELEC01]TDE66711.1 MAG: hypothetical protein D8M57_01345 [Candidatus Scalindua sp. AMX11]GJQ58018.1 MAG: hypothetical protein SCALA701_08190 [Candidatus Scalindua sp.]
MSKLILATVFLFCGSTAFDNYDEYVVKDVPAHAVADYYTTISVAETQRTAMRAIKEQKRLQKEQREAIESIKQEIRALQLLRGQVVEVL